MRRKDRQVTDQKEILEIIEKCNVCRLALKDDDCPYILPLNFGLDVKEGQITLYFHSALEGHKVQLLKKGGKAAFEMDCDHSLYYDEERGYCTFGYESVIGKGSIDILENDEEKLYGLERIMAKNHGGEAPYFNPAAVPRTLVYKLSVEEITGKRKVNPDKK